MPKAKRLSETEYARLLKPAPCIVAAWVLFGSSTGVFAQSDADTTDTLARAAFCVGVLTETQQFSQTDPMKGSAACDNGGWQRDGDASMDACLAKARRVVDMTLAQAQQRYAGYLANHALNSSAHQVEILMAMGKSAVRAAREKDDGLKGRCALECGGAQTPVSQNLYGDCLIPCIERSDREQANLDRCLMSPDHLPF
jgi:hypothetical protein